MCETRKKLTSSAGASIGISLLLFLVCAVLGSIILTAGTTTMGRVYAVSDSDQRYYSVTSAAELLSKELTGKPVTITKVKTTVGGAAPTYTTTIPVAKSAAPELDPSESESEEPDAPQPKVKTISDTSLVKNLGIDSLLTKMAAKLMFGEMPCNTELAMKATFAEGRYMMRESSEGGTIKDIVDTTATEEKQEFKIEHGTERDNLRVLGSCTMKKDGTLIIELKNAPRVDREGNPVESGTYTLTLTLTPVFDEHTSVSRTTDYSTGVVTEKTTMTSNVEWEVGGISKRFEG